jgi:hypothetical protein
MQISWILGARIQSPKLYVAAPYVTCTNDILSHRVGYTHTADCNSNIFRIQRRVEQHWNRIKIYITVGNGGVFAVSD